MYKSHYSHEIEEGNGHGFCETVSADGVGPLTVLEFHVILHICSFSALAWWIRRKYVGNTSSFYTSRDQVIFPIHMKILKVLVCALLLEASFSTLYDLYSGIGISFLIATIICTGLSATLLAGITMLLISPAIGRRALKKSVHIGLILGLLTICANFLYFDDPEAFLTDILIGCWEIIILIIISFIWLSPYFGLTSFRPAAVYWARFWTIFRILLIISLLLMEFNIDIGWCVYHLSTYLFYGVLNVWVAYQVFVMETQWWHGMYVQQRNELKNNHHTCMKTCCTRWLNISSNDLKDINNIEEDLRYTEGEAINFAFTGIELSDASAQAMSEVLDTYQRTKAPSGGGGGGNPHRGSRGSTALSLTMPSTSLGSRALSGFSSTSLSTSTHGIQHRHSSQNKFKLSKLVVPLIDFSKVKIKSDRLLGTGSSARVYEGRWSGKVCAVKVLFTVEITPEEIKRTCHEASLLHHLCKHSENVVRLFGVAVLPPSLCVVLELCNGGSLFDILYEKVEVEVEEELRSGGGFGSSLTSFSFTSNKQIKDQVLVNQAEVERLSFVNKFSINLDSLRSSESIPIQTEMKQIQPPPPTSTTSLSNQQHHSQRGVQERQRISHFKHKLPWLHQLDLAYGASLGIEAIVNHLPGYSHNDIKSANFLVHHRKERPPSHANSTTSSNTILQQQHEQARRNIRKSQGGGGGAGGGGGGGGGGGVRKLSHQSPLYNNRGLEQEFAYCVKIADMEFASKNVTPEHTKNGNTPNWTAPEVLNGNEKVSPASDVYSLSNVFYEIESRRIPFHNNSNPKDIVNQIKLGQRPKFVKLRKLNSTKKKNVVDVDDDNEEEEEDDDDDNEDDDEEEEEEKDHVGLVDEVLTLINPTDQSNKVSTNHINVQNMNSSNISSNSLNGTEENKEEKNNDEDEDLILLRLEYNSRKEFRKIVKNGWSQNPIDRSDVVGISTSLYDLRKEYINDLKNWELHRNKTKEVTIKLASSFGNVENSLDNEQQKRNSTTDVAQRADMPLRQITQIEIRQSLQNEEQRQIGLQDDDPGVMI